MLEFTIFDISSIIKKVSLTKSRLNEVNDIMMNYKIDVSKHNFTKNIIVSDANKVKEHIQATSLAQKKITESAATKNAYTKFQSNTTFGGAHVNVLTWMEFLEEFLIKKNFVSTRNMSLDTFSPSSIGGI